MDDNIEFTATYSAEDNKLRLYTSERVSTKLYAQLKENGFVWAPKQKLFVSPSWSPKREDLLIDIAGEITAEQTTLVERAKIKSDRLDGYSEKRAKESNAFADAADQISQRFSCGQPILMGHHSQRKAERDAERMNLLMSKSSKAMKTSDYWNYRVSGVINHANQKSSDRTRSNRIKTLLAELRSRQRSLNFSMKMVDFWGEIGQIESEEKKQACVERYCGAFSNDGGYSFRAAWDLFNEGKASADEIIERSIKVHQNALSNPYQYRCINHLLGRLGYERSELGTIEKFKGEVTGTILQAFLRTHGADKPKASKEGNLWKVTSVVNLPLHISESNELVLTASEWIDLMHSSGYEVPADKPKQPPILNFKAKAIKFKGRGYKNEAEIFEQVEMSKAEFSALYIEKRCVMLSECGQFRFKVYFDHWSRPTVCVFITDSKAHEMPVSDSIILNSEEVAI